MKVYIEGTNTDCDGRVVNLQGFHGPRFRFHLRSSGEDFTFYLYPTGKVRWEGDIPLEIWAPKDADI